MAACKEVEKMEELNASTGKMEELNAREREVLDDAKKRHRPSLRLSKWHAAGFARLPMPDHVAQPESSSMPVLYSCLCNSSLVFTICLVSSAGCTVLRSVFIARI